MRRCYNRRGFRPSSRTTTARRSLVGERWPFVERDYTLRTRRLVRRSRPKLDLLHPQDACLGGLVTVPFLDDALGPRHGW
jgi:hypothetical protein